VPEGGQVGGGPAEGPGPCGVGTPGRAFARHVTGNRAHGNKGDAHWRRSIDRWFAFGWVCPANGPAIVIVGVCLCVKTGQRIRLCFVLGVIVVDHRHARVDEEQGEGGQAGREHVA